MPRSALARTLVAALALGLAACGRPAPDPEQKPRAIEDPEEIDALQQAADAQAEARARARAKPRWKRKVPPMPETFAAFERPDLAALEGAWLVDSEIPGQQVLWLIEEDGAKLTEIDHRERERVFGISLASPCALRLTDERGHARTRVIAARGDQLIAPRGGATAVAGSDGSMLACAGHRTYQIAADGRCRYTTEMLGSWSDPAEPSETCKLSKGAKGATLRLGDQRLRDYGGLWVDEDNADRWAVKVDDRAAGLAALTRAAAPAEPATETGADPGADPGSDTGTETG
ncbi:hypothetical protein [Enhygromyxa salina]|nr:hypothetical protein [Enhygromyxa salina]